MGAPAEVIAQAQKSKTQTECLVDPDNWETLTIFLSLSSQWRVISGMGGVIYQGLDFPSIESAFRLHGTKKKNQKEIFDSLLIMQAEASKILNKGK